MSYSYLTKAKESDHLVRYIDELRQFGFLSELRVREVEDFGFAIEIFSGGMWQNASVLGSGAQYILRLTLAIESLEYFHFWIREDPEWYTRTKRLCLIEEPETGLHPGWQSLLMQYLARKAKEYWQFVIETHSEYFVRTLQLLIASGHTPCSSVLVNNVRSDHSVQLIEFTDEGGMSSDFEPGFLDESDSILMALMKFNIDRSN
jgi:predicted ATPase